MENVITKILSIVSVVKNDSDGLTSTINSISMQSFNNVESIVVDGGSSDNTLDVIKKNSEYIDYWVSEPDNGIYDAMNKGLERATGDYILFLNAGDCFYSKYTLQTALSHFHNHSTIYFGRAKYLYKHISWYHPSLSIKNVNKNLIPSHQATFFPRKFYEKNRFDTTLKIAADHEYFLRAVSQFPYEFINETLVKFELGGVSNRPKSLKESLAHYKEYRQVRNMYPEWYGKFKFYFSFLLYIGKYFLGLFLPEIIYYKILKLKNTTLKKIDSI